MYVKLSFYTVPTRNRTPGRCVAVHYTTAAPRQLHSKMMGTDGWLISYNLFLGDLFLFVMCILSLNMCILYNWTWVDCWFFICWSQIEIIHWSFTSFMKVLKMTFSFFSREFFFIDGSQIFMSHGKSVLNLFFYINWFLNFLYGMKNHKTVIESMYVAELDKNWISM